MERKNICYYSNKCKWSEAFIKELSNTSYKRDFIFICVDPPLRQPLPKFLKKVPTLVIQGEGEPRVDSEVMNWLYEQKLRQQPTNQTSAETSEPDGWSSLENVSFAKGFGYSFNDSDTSSGGNGGNLLPGSFSFLNGNSGVGDKTSNDFNPGRTGEQGRTKSKKEELFDKQMEEYQRSRDIGMPKPRMPM